jgi:2-alkyl-3-oxoalkanoate reductase
MKVFVAGATGAIGKQLVPMLVEVGHEVTGMTRSPGKVASIEAMGARAAVADALDPEAVAAVVAEAEPEAIIHELTAIETASFGRNIDKLFAPTNRLRTEGTDHLLAAARAAGTRRFVAQSFAGWPFKRVGGPVKSEEEPLEDHPPKHLRQTLAAIRHVESAVTGAEGIEGVVLRYGGFYGPATSLALDPPGDQTEMIRRRRFPIVGDGSAIWSLIHIRDAAAATVAALERGRSGLYNVVDDDPVPLSVFLPEAARIMGAPAPRHVPKWLGRLAAGEAATVMMTEIRGASNEKTKRELGWEPEFPSWRLGLREESAEMNRATAGSAA